MVLISKNLINNLEYNFNALTLKKHREVEYEIKWLSVLDIDKKLFDWSKIKNKLVLIVNVASKCGYAKQYEQLEYLYQKYKNKGFVIIAFPCRQFMFQEFDDNNK